MSITANNSKELHREDVSFLQPFSRLWTSVSLFQRYITRCLGMITVDLDDALTASILTDLDLCAGGVFTAVKPLCLSLHELRPVHSHV